MNFNKTFIQKFATVSIALAIVHAIGETYFTIALGQSIVQILADTIAVFLVIFGGKIARKNPLKNGILCGAWGFAFCLNYRAFAWRFDEIISGNQDSSITITFYILFFSLLISAVFFTLSMLFNLPKTAIK